MLGPPSSSVTDDVFTSAGTGQGAESSLGSLGVQSASEGNLAADNDRSMPDPIGMPEAANGQLQYPVQFTVCADTVDMPVHVATK